MLLKNKTVVLTGCNRGIGKAILGVFAKNGASIWACVRPSFPSIAALEEIFMMFPLF